MAKLKDLIVSLTTTLIRYHDCQKVNVCVKESDPTAALTAWREYAVSLLDKPAYESELTRLNIESTGKHRADRLPLLNFIKDEIVSLKNIMDRKLPFSAVELERFKLKVTCLLIDLQKLLNTNKTEIHSVQITNINDPVATTIPLPGLFDRGFVSSTLCTSGTIIKEEILEQFNIKLSTADTDICKIAEELFQTYQDAVLRTELEQARSTIAEMRLELQKAESELARIRLELKAARILIGEQDRTISSQSSMIDFYGKKSKREHHTLFFTHQEDTGRPKPPSLSILDNFKVISRI